jgi:uncharacterized protein YoxC
MTDRAAVVLAIALVLSAVLIGGGLRSVARAIDLGTHCIATAIEPSEAC